MLASNYYSCLSPPLCQVEEHKQLTKQVTFKTTIEISDSTPAAARSKIKTRWERIIQKQRDKEQGNNTVEKNLPTTTTHVIGINDDKIREAMRTGKISLPVADSGATSSIGTENDPSKRTNSHQPKNLDYQMGRLYQQKK